MCARPGAVARGAGVEPAAGVGDVEAQRALLLPQPHRRARTRPAVLGRVLKGLQAAEVDGGLELGRVAPGAVGVDAHGRGCMPGDRAQRLGAAAVEQQRRVDALCELADLIDRLLGGAAGALEHGARLRRLGVDEVGGEPQVHDHSDQLLLRAIVNVALDPPALGVGRADDACARGAELVGLAAQFVERSAQLGVEVDVAERQPELACEIGEQAVVGDVERRAGRAFDEDQPEQLAGVRDRGDPQRALAR